MRVAYAARVFSFFSVYSAQQRFSPWRHGTVVAPVFVDLNNPVSVQAQERNRVQRLCIIRRLDQDHADGHVARHTPRVPARLSMAPG